MKRKVWVVIAIVMGLSLGAGAVEFTDSFGDFISNHASGLGTTFTPAKATLGGDVPDPLPQTVYLTDWTYAKSSSGYGTESGREAYLAVFSALTLAGMNADTLLGVSTNYVDMVATPTVYPESLMTWQFDYIALDKDTQYAMMFVGFDDTGAMILIGGGVELETGNPYAYGGYIRFNEVANDWDPDFIAAYSTDTPYASNPYPASGAVNVETDVVMSWTGPSTYTAVGYNVYADPNSSNLTAEKASYYSAAQPGSTYTPGSVLEYDTTYYWCVESLEPNDVGSQQPFIHTGPVWIFTTQPDEARILTGPISQTVTAGTTVEFLVTTINAETYQWYKDGVALTSAPALYSGETTAMLSIYDVQLDDEGTYHCVVDNSLKLPDISGKVQLMTQRLAGWWKLDGDLTDSVALAVPGAILHDGTSPDPNYVGVGKDGGAMQFFGDVEGLVVFSNSADFFNFYPQGYTVSAWVKTTTAPPAWGAYVAKQGSDPARGFILTETNAGNAVHTLRQSFSDLNSNTKVNDDVWHLVTGTYDGVLKQGKIYVDGVLRNQATSTGTPVGSPADLIFGAEFPDGRVAYIGLLDDVRIWSYPLDAVAAAKLYTDFNPGSEICTQYPIYDIAGPNGVGTEYRDCRVNLYDFVPVADAWLECNIVPTCIL